MMWQQRQQHLARWTGTALTMPRVREWAYAVPGKRDMRLDLLRGFAVFVMIVDHFGGASWLYLITGNNSFFVSGAEAFVFISGLVVGMVYGDIALKQGLCVAQRKALERAWTLYKLTVILTLAFALLSKFFVLPWADDLRIDHPLTWLIEVVTLHRTFYFSDVMLMYTFLMVAASGALWFLLKRRTWLLLAVSFVLWLVFQIAPDRVVVPWHIEGNGTFNLAAWQLLFIAAMVIGFHRDAMARRLASLPRLPYFLLVSLGLALLINVYASNGAFIAALVPNIDVDEAMRLLFLKSALAPGRLIAGFIVFQFAYLLATICWKPIAAFVGGVLTPLGQNALYCYTVHVFLVSIAHVVFHQFPALPAMGTLNTFLQLATIGVVWLMVQKQFLFRVIPR